MSNWSKSPLAAEADHREEYNLRVIRPVLNYLKDNHREDTTREILLSVGINLPELDLDDLWISKEQIEAILEEARRVLGSDETFMEAAAYQLRRAYGPLTVIFRFASLSRVTAILERTSYMVTRASHFETVRTRRNLMWFRYHADRPESRLMCMTRVATYRALPVIIWGGKLARVTELQCMARGDACCEYQVRFQEPFRWRGPVLGALSGAGGGWGVYGLLSGPWAIPVLSVLGFTAGLHLALRRSHLDHEAFMEAKSRELEHFVAQYVQAVGELLRLHNRQQSWSSHLEQRLADRTQDMESMLEGLARLRKQDRSALRDLSHDLRNPLAVIRAATTAAAESLGELADRHPGEERDEDLAMVGRYLDFALGGAGRLDAMIADLVTFAEDRIAQPDHAMEHTRLESRWLADRIRGRLRALVLGRPVRTGVHLAPEVPDAIRTDPDLLDRVMDNLLTNAAKYTDHGSIQVEMGAVPGRLVIKIADTGRGISPERMELVLQGEAGPDQPSVGDSRSLGLAVTVRLLDRMGGRLEVLSRPGKGTTFWVYLPREPTNPPVASCLTGPEEEPIQKVFGRVVTIRAAND